MWCVKQSAYVFFVEVFFLPARWLSLNVARGRPTTHSYGYAGGNLVADRYEHSGKRLGLAADPASSSTRSRGGPSF